jgi:FkbM family methyltransferase
LLFNRYFKINNIYSFEASPINFKILNEKTKNIKMTKINIFNLALGKKNTQLMFNQSVESQSSTFLNVNLKSKYLARKKKFLFLKEDEYFTANILYKL